MPVRCVCVVYVLVEERGLAPYGVRRTLRHCDHEMHTTGTERGQGGVHFQIKLVLVVLAGS